MPPYTKVHDPWHDFPAVDTPIDAAALDQIEEGVETAQQSADTAQTAANAAAAAAASAQTNLDNHAGDTTNQHGIADFAQLETQTGAQTKATNAQNAAQTFAANADNISSGTLAEARVHSSIARLASPIFTGDPKAPTPPDADDDTSIANTLWARARIVEAINALRVFENGDGTVVDTSVSDFISLDLANLLPTKAVQFASHPILMGARFCTFVALPACTYNNGSFGVGATLTGTSNGALTLAGEYAGTPSVNDRILVVNQANLFENGPYDLTQVGSAGTPFILTRAPEADEATDYVDGVTVLISDGQTNKGSVWHFAGTITMGTSQMNWLSLQTPNAAAYQYYGGGSRNRRRYHAEFENFDTSITTNATSIPGTSLWCFMNTGSSQAVSQQHGDTGGSIGVASCDTGTSATASVAVVLSRSPATLNSSVYARFSARYRTPTITVSGGEEFDCWIGWMSWIVGSDPVDCIAIKAPANGGNYLAVTRSGGTETATDTGQAQGTLYKPITIIIDPVAQEVRFYSNMTGGINLVATNNTNIPTVALFAGGLIDKKNGTASRSLRLDCATQDVPDTRSNFQMM